MRYKKFFAGTAILVGTVIGAGIFGIPYTIAKAGFIPGMILLVLLTVVILLTHLCYGEVILRTKKEYQMPGYAEKYLGKWGKFFTSFSLISGIYGALLAYAVLAGDFLEALFGGTSFLYSLIFFIVMYIAIFIGLKLIANIELAFIPILIILILIFSIIGFSHIKIDNLLTSDYRYFLFPFGVLMFALTGASAVPQAREVLRGEEKYFKKAIIWGSVIPAILYFIFAFVTIGITGINTTYDAMAGLGSALGRGVLIGGIIFGILNIIDSFLALGLALKKVYRSDYKINNILSWILVCSVPLILFLAGATDFVKILEIVGGLTIGPTGILLLLMYLRAKEKGEREPEFKIKIPKIVLYLMIWVYVLGMVYVVADLMGVV